MSGRKIVLSSSWGLYKQIEQLPKSNLTLMDVNTTLAKNDQQREIQELIYVLIYHFYNGRPPRPNSNTKCAVLYSEGKLDPKLVQLICNFVGFLVY